MNQSKQRNNMIPRIRGRVGLGEDNKHYFELSLWNFTGEKMIGEPFVIGPFKDESEAKQELKIAAQLACEAVEKGQGFKPSGKYLDMKSGGIMRPWTEQ